MAHQQNTRRSILLPTPNTQNDAQSCKNFTHNVQQNIEQLFQNFTPNLQQNNGRSTQKFTPNTTIINHANTGNKQFNPKQMHQIVRHSRNQLNAQAARSMIIHDVNDSKQQTLGCTADQFVFGYNLGKYGKQFTQYTRFMAWDGPQKSVTKRFMAWDGPQKSVTKRSHFAGQKGRDTRSSSMGIVPKLSQQQISDVKKEKNISYSSVDPKVYALMNQLDKQKKEGENRKYTNEENIFSDKSHVSEGLSEQRDELIKHVKSGKYMISKAESENTNTCTAKRTYDVTTAFGCSDNFSNKGDNVGMEHNETKFTSRSEVGLTEEPAESKHKNVDVPACKVIPTNDSIKSKTSSEIAICSMSEKCVISIKEACVNKKSYDSVEMSSDGNWRNDIEKQGTFNTELQGIEETIIDSKISWKKSQSLSKMDVENKHLKKDVSIDESNSGDVSSYLIDKNANNHLMTVKEKANKSTGSIHVKLKIEELIEETMYLLDQVADKLEPNYKNYFEQLDIFHEQFLNIIKGKRRIQKGTNLQEICNLTIPIHTYTVNSKMHNIQKVPKAFMDTFHNFGQHLIEIAEVLHVIEVTYLDFEDTFIKNNKVSDALMDKYFDFREDLIKQKEVLNDCVQKYLDVEERLLSFSKVLNDCVQKYLDVEERLLSFSKDFEPDQSMIGLTDVENLCHASEDDLMDIERQKGKSDKPKNNGLDPQRHAFGAFTAGELRNEWKTLLQVITVHITTKTLRDALQGVRRPFYLWSADNESMLSKIREIQVENLPGSIRPNGYMERLSTFKCRNNPTGIIWNEDQTVKPEQLVSAGFSFDGIKDQVTCKLCKCTSDVSKWDRNDDDYALSVHKGLSKDCKFVRTYGGSSFPEDVPSDYNTYFFQTITFTSEICEKISKKTYFNVDSCKSLKHYYDDDADNFKEVSICAKMLVYFKKFMHTLKFHWSQNSCKKYIYKIEM